MAELVGITEIARRLHVSRQRAHVLAGHDDFPAPVDELSQGRVWNARDVERWIKRNPQYDHSEAT